LTRHARNNESVQGQLYASRSDDLGQVSTSQPEREVIVFNWGGDIYWTETSVACS